jgi:hypothetical protein
MSLICAINIGIFIFWRCPAVRCYLFPAKGAGKKISAAHERSELAKQSGPENVVKHFRFPLHLATFA